MNKNPLFIAFVVILLVLGIIFIPLAQIWAVNTLFNLSIVYSFKTWIATVLLGVFFRGTGIIFKK